MNSEEIVRATIQSVIQTLKEMKNGEEGSEDLYKCCKNAKANTFDNGYDFAVDLLKESLADF